MAKSFWSKINCSDLYILGWLVVSMITSSQPSSISGKIMVLLTLWSFYYFIRVLFSKTNTKVVRTLNLLVVMFSVYGLLHVFFGSVLYVQATDVVVSTNNYIKGIYASILPIYAFYSFAQRNLITKDKIRFWSLLFVFVAIVQYYNIYMNTALAFIKQDSFTNNAGYIVVSLFPLLALWNRKYFVKLLISLLIVVLAVLSAKRGAILISFLCITFTFRSVLKDGSNSNKLKIYSIIAIAVFALFFFLKEQLANNDYLLKRLEGTLAGDTNGRDEISSNFLSYYTNEYNLVQQIFGGGAENTINISDNYAHNDWIEILINNGILGFVIYLYFWITMIKTWLKSRNSGFVYEVLGLYVIIYLPMTLFSMSYIGIQIYSSIMLGIAFSELNNRRILSRTDEQ